jgi:hypothetical protein
MSDHWLFCAEGGLSNLGVTILLQIEEDFLGWLGDDLLNTCSVYPQIFSSSHFP